MQGTRGRRRAGGEAGVGSVEYIGAIVVVVALVGSLLVAATPVGQAIAAKLCEAFGTTCGAVTSADRAPADYVPPEPCVVSSHGGENSANVSFVVTLEGGEKWLVEELGDGTYRLTHQGEGGVSIGVGIGGGGTVTVDDQEYGANASAQASAGVGVAGGTTFYVDSKDEAMELLTQQRQDVTKDSLLGDGGPARWLYDQAADAVGDDLEGEQREADEWFVEGGIYGNGSAGVEGGLPGLQADTGAEASVEKYLGRTERSDGTSTEYLRAEMSGDANFSGNVPDEQGNNSFLTNGIGGKMSAVIEVDRDEDGNPVALRMVSAVGGHMESDEGYSREGLESSANGMTSRTIQIPLESASDRDVASRLLQTMGVPYVPGVTDPSDVTDAAVTPNRFIDLSRDLGNLARESGYIYEQEYTEDSSTDLALQVDAELGAITGIGGSSVSNARTTTGYRYWNGQEMVERSGCAA